MDEERGSLAGGMAGMLNVFIDPAATAKRVPNPWSWLWPVLVLSAVYLVFAYQLLPYSLQLMDATLAQRQVPPEALERTRGMMHTTTQITTPLTPVLVIGFMLLIALCVKGVYGIMDIRPKFRDVFSLLAACSLIPMLQYVATYFVIRMKGDAVETPEQMTPPFGLDIFLPGIHGPLLALIGFFSIFEIWFIVVLVVGLAALTRSSKMQALLASTPAWLLPLAFRLIGSLFQNKAA